MSPRPNNTKYADNNSFNQTDNQFQEANFKKCLFVQKSNSKNVCFKHDQFKNNITLFKEEYTSKLDVNFNILNQNYCCDNQHCNMMIMNSNRNYSSLPQCRAAKIAAQEIDNLVKKASQTKDNAERYMREVIHEVWDVCHFNSLPKWLQDNEFLHTGHRPPLKSFRACFWSIFRVHTETGNIWTHMIGCFIFLILGSYFLFLSSHALSYVDRIVIGIFFAGAVSCLGLSSCYHTLSCHSPRIGKLFSKLDYCGIAFLITGSFIPWLYYSFYCEYYPKLLYSVIVSSFCIGTIIVSLWDKFSEPHYRPIRAAVFMFFGLSGIFPGFHWLLSQNWLTSFNLKFSFFCIILMGVLYVTGGFLYACRIPERFFPGKCDYWLHSHQLFHVFVIAAAMVYYHGISELVLYRINSNQVCPIDNELVQF